ncbi:MAG: Sulfate-transporting ATPase, partial [Frankiales bacterium]|nr:Sulfate-transporting ATPase [Frankiales bacterium]
MNLLPFIVAGVASGAVYGLAGVGLVLTYKTSGIFNFAHGTIATVSAFLFYWLHIQHHLDWRVSALLSLLIAGPVLGVALERLARAATSSPLGVRVVATIGLLTFIQAAVVIRFGTQYHTVPGFLGSGTFHIGDTVVTYAQVIILVLAVVATAGLYAYFRVSRGGVAMRAVVDDPDLLDMMGTNPVAVRRRAWVIGATFASVSGILLVQLLGQVDSITLTLLVVQAFGAAALGRFKNLPVTFIGGISLGVGTSLCTKYFQRGLSSGLAASLPFIVLIVVLLITPKQSLAERPFIIRRTRAAWRAPGSIQITGAVLIGGFLLFLPHFAGLHLDSWTAFLTNVIMFLSLGLLVRTSGQVSLSQVSFLAIGVSAFSHLLVDKHVPWLLALILTGLIAVPIGAMLAIPAIRLSGLYLALVSLGSGILLQYMFYSQRYMFGSSGFGLKVPRPHVSWLHVSSDRGYYYLVLALTVLIAALLVALIRGRLGRLLRALATSPTGLSTSGTSVNITRVLVFCMAAFIAAIAGALGGGVNGVVSADSYPPLLSLTYFVVITITVGGEPWFALFAALGLNVIPIYFHNKNITNYLMLLFGLFAMLYVMTPPDKRGIPESVTRVIDRIGRRRVKAPIDVVEEPAANTIAPMSVALTQAPEAEPAIATPLLGDCALEVANLRVQFGGLIALDGVSLRAPAGRITGL